MPYSLQSSGPHFVHEGWVPAYPDSHGCVRLRYEDARLLFYPKYCISRFLLIGIIQSIDAEGWRTRWTSERRHAPTGHTRPVNTGQAPMQPQAAGSRREP